MSARIFFSKNRLLAILYVQASVGAGGLATGLRRGGEGFSCWCFYFWWWYSCFGLIYSFVVVFSFVFSFIASLMPGLADKWAPCCAIRADAGLFDQKKKIIMLLTLYQLFIVTS